MKFSVLLVLSCALCICLGGDPTLKTWGNVNGRIIGTENVFKQSSFMQVTKHYLKYPNVSELISTNRFKGMFVNTKKNSESFKNRSFSQIFFLIHLIFYVQIGSTTVSNQRNQNVGLQITPDFC